MIANIFRFVIILGLCCLVMGGGVATLYAVFKGRLEARETAAQQEAITNVCPPGAAVDASAPLVGKPFAEDAVYVAKAADGKPAAYVAGGADPGYSSVVRVMVGATRDGDTLVIYKVAVLSQAETPGLGANIAETRSNYTLWMKLFGSTEPEQTFTPFIGDFAGKRQDQVQEIQAITAATITSDAVKSAVDQALHRIRGAVKQ